jgi:putative redox protein
MANRLEVGDMIDSSFLEPIIPLENNKRLYFSHKEGSDSISNLSSGQQIFAGERSSPPLFIFAPIGLPVYAMLSGHTHTERSKAFMVTEDAKAVIHHAGDDLFVCVSPSGHAQAIDTNHERASAASPVELLLIALGSCTAVDVISILRKKREQVTSYRVEVRGERRSEHPRHFTRMEVRHIVRGHNISERALRQAIELSETKYCSVAATLRPTVEIVSIHEIIEESEPVS